MSTFLQRFMNLRLSAHSEDHFDVTILSNSCRLDYA